MSNSVSERLSEIRERVEAATEVAEWEVGISRDRGYPVFRFVAMEPPADESAQSIRRFIQNADEDVPYLLSLVGYLREELCLRTCNCGPTDPNPEKHAGYCNYVEAIEEVSAALRDAAQEGAE